MCPLGLSVDLSPAIDEYMRKHYSRKKRKDSYNLSQGVATKINLEIVAG